MVKERLTPDYIFESSWEVCNKVGGIYTVLSTRAKTLQSMMPDRILFVGPDCWEKTICPFFEEDKELFAAWAEQMSIDGLPIRVGRWTVPGRPIALLVDFRSLWVRKNEYYGQMWQDFGVDSLHGYGDYDEASMFSLAAAMVVERFYHYYLGKDYHVLYHANEWMTGMGLLYLRKYLPQTATLFTTHATSIGRSIAGNGKPLYQYLSAYNGDQMAGELNMESKHSIEKQAAWHADCFSTVSEITAQECAALLDKPVDVVLPNGFENAFVPKGAALTQQRRKARKRLLQLANCLTGEKFPEDTLIVSTNGRYEFRNKGLDVFIEAMHRLSKREDLKCPVLAFLEVPGWVASPRADLQERMQTNEEWSTPLEHPYLTHWLHNMEQDNILSMLHHLGVTNGKETKVKIIFIPTYLMGEDGVVDLSYYELLPGNDLCIYPSYYEPWGYTPLESIAFHVPCISTDLAGFGLWVNGVLGRNGTLSDGVEVVHRTDYNYNEVADAIATAVYSFSQMEKEEVRTVRNRAAHLSSKALWKHFIRYYEDAYHQALIRCQERQVTSQH